MSLSRAMHKRADCVVIAAPLEEIIHPDTLCILVEPQAVDLAGRQRKCQFYYLLLVRYSSRTGSAVTHLVADPVEQIRR